MRWSAFTADAEALSGHLADRIREGPDVLARADELARWREARLRAGIWAWSSSVDPPIGPRATLRNDAGIAVHGLNFVTQDPLALGTHPARCEVAIEAVRRYGVHAPGPLAFAGASGASAALEAAVGEFFGLEHVVLFPSGWSAAFGAVTALLGSADHVVIDACAHASLRYGAEAATRHVHPHPHLDLDAVAAELHAIRRDHARAGILVVTESLFPFEADTPDLPALHRICRAHDATLLVAVGHDLGITGPGGTGILGAQDMLAHVDVVVGSFAKTLAANGGFLAVRSAGAKQLVRLRAATHASSNAQAPLQAALARESLRLVGCDEGAQLRANLARAVTALRDACGHHRLPCIGTAGAIVPIAIGDEHLARVTEACARERGVLVALVEEPLLPRGAARLALHATAAHRREHAIEAADKIAAAFADASAATGRPSHPR